MHTISASPVPISGGTPCARHDSSPSRLSLFSPAQEKIDNPEFASWSKFKKGTSVTLKTSTDAGGMKTESTVTTTLVESGADNHVVETTVVSKFNGMEFKARR